MKKLDYEFLATYRRKMLDYLQEKYSYLYNGIVLDIGGRIRGKFKKPKNKVKKWIYADINRNYNPDIVLDVANMKQIDSNSIDVINAIELFEHVKEIEQGLEECYRVLKKGGIIIISIPFLFHIHGDPYDYQRWTHFKWRFELNKIGFKIEKFVIMGKFFTHLADMIKFGIKAVRNTFNPLGFLLKLLKPILNVLVNKDNTSIVRKDPILNNYHYGYFIIARK